jgi:hypothetical protein
MANETGAGQGRYRGHARLPDRIECPRPGKPIDLVDPGRHLRGRLSSGQLAQPVLLISAAWPPGIRRFTQGLPRKP